MIALGDISSVTFPAIAIDQSRLLGAHRAEDRSRPRRSRLPRPPRRRCLQSLAGDPDAGDGASRPVLDGAGTDPAFGTVPSETRHRPRNRQQCRPRRHFPRARCSPTAGRRSSLDETGKRARPLRDAGRGHAGRDRPWSGEVTELAAMNDQRSMTDRFAAGRSRSRSLRLAASPFAALLHSSTSGSPCRPPSRSRDAGPCARPSGRPRLRHVQPQPPARDGAGYDFLADVVVDTDSRNPQVAARLLSAFRSWRALEPGRRDRARAALERVAAVSTLSPDVRDIVARSLG